MKFKQNILRIFVVSVLFCAMAFGFSVQTVFALPPYGYTGPRDTYAPFGGFVSEVFWCACSRNLRITLGNLCTEPPKNPDVTPANNPEHCDGTPNILMFDPAVTILYPYYQIYRSGVWLLGLWHGEEPCIVPTVDGCVTIGVYPLMYMVGTSM